MLATDSVFESILRRAVLLLFISVTFAACSTYSGAGRARDQTGAAHHSGETLFGKYEYSSGGGRNDVYIAVSITGEGDQAAIDFQAAHPDAHGAAPDGDGSGRIGPDGVFRFTYSDSFENVGSGTFRRTKDGYALSMEILTVADSRCLPFYGDFVLHRMR